jgi:methylenetetrahydrofolate reductase (NADPH)
MKDLCPISFEFFPPKTPEGEAKLKQVRQDLYALKPEYFSVTYGAGGSTQDGTLQQVQAILKDGFDAAPHFSCIGATRDSVRAQLAEFKAAGIVIEFIKEGNGDIPAFSLKQNGVELSFLKQ